MKQNNERLNWFYRPNVRLVSQTKKDDSQTIALIARPVNRVDYSQAISLLLLLDLSTVSIVSAFIGFLTPEAATWIYPIHFFLFGIMAYILKLYNLSTCQYMVGKMVVLGIVFLTAQTFLFLLEGASSTSIIASYVMNIAFFGLLSGGHHVLTRPYAIPNQSSVFYKIERYLKQVFDYTIASIGVLFALPIFLTVSLFIFFEDRKSIFFLQPRIGHKEKTFLMYKFRSMRLDADTALAKANSQSAPDEPTLYKLKDDPRITKFGHIIRKLSVDELPQLWNVLQGDMSIVGPRPPLLREFDLMEDEHRKKFIVKPGITGLWQITGRVNNERSFQAVSYYDNHYIDNWCFFNDLMIVLRTIPVVILQKGAW